jgi:hypothetical protein
MPPNCWKPSQDNVRNALIGLQEMVKGELTGDDVTVVLLLPTDDAPLADRAAALGQWCQGFLTGFGLNAGGKDLSTRPRKCCRTWRPFPRCKMPWKNPKTAKRLHGSHGVPARRAAAAVHRDWKPPRPAAKPSLH